MKRSTERDPNQLQQHSKVGTHCLIILNDDVNSYEHVIESLVEVCNHNTIQAEQCTFIAHHKGKCDVRVGEYSKLKNMKDELSRRGISSIIHFV